MEKNKLTIRINKTPKEIFEFTLDPANTSKWIDFIKNEQVNEEPIRLGTIYKNVSKAGVIGEYIVTMLEKDTAFELTSKNKNFHVKYTFTSINNTTTEMEYVEWVEQGELEDPFTIAPLKKLKEILEKK